LFKCIKAAVFVTHELQKSDSYNQICNNSIVISNGIPIHDFKTLPTTDNQNPVLSFLGTSNFIWHGIDKVVEMAKLLSDHKFYIIGPSIKKHISSVPENVTFTGFLEYDEYLTHLKKTDIAIGTLALHRKVMNEACALKVREYLALGLPVILAYDDTDFLDDTSFILKLPNSENNIVPNIDLIKRFINSWVNKRVSKDLISHIDIREKEKKRLELFHRIIKS
jgi:glycosyltransferase involved in cell wall biosynthesis